MHVPFCYSECVFCNSFPNKVDETVQQAYLRDLIKEIELFSLSGILDGKAAKCIYFGGGTPTSFSNSHLQLIIEAITAHIEIPKTCSITCEAHPATLADEERIAGLASIGFTRISMGCQTFDRHVLDLCNRRNTEPQISKIIKLVQAAGLAVNIDMMTGLPGQTLAGIRTDLLILENLRPDAVEYIRHEIVNPLAVKLYQDHPELVLADDVLFEMVLLTQEWMETHGYEQNGRFSHGKQWEYRYHWLHEMPIIAFGPRARSYTSTICYDKHEDLSTYSLMIGKGVPPIGRYISLTKREQMYRSLFLGIQLKSGLDVKMFHARFQENPHLVFGPLLAKLQKCGCIAQDEASIHLTQYGAYFVEDVCDYIIDTALREESNDLVRAPHSTGRTSSRLNATADRVGDA